MTKTLEIVHTNVCGLMRTKGINGESYFLLFIDDHTGMTWVFFLKKKSEAFECFKIFKEVLQNKIDLNIKSIILDNGG